MALRLRSPALIWGPAFILAATGATLRFLRPGHPALPAISATLLGLLTLRMGVMVLDWRRGHLPGTRILLPAVLVAEGLGLLVTPASALAGRIRLGTALVLEILLLGLALKVWKGTKGVPGAWPEERLALAFEAFVPPRAARLMALELVMLGSALRFLCGGFRDLAPTGLSHHRESALRSLLPALPLLIPADMLLIHALFPRMAPWMRWTLHGSTVYAVLWMFGFYATLKARPHQIVDGQLHLRLGLLKSVVVPRGQVRSAAPLPEFDDDWARHRHMKGVQKLVAAGAPVLELRLASPVAVRGLLGPGRPTDRLAVSMDDPAAFLASLESSCA
ncbi:hypothetical protein [Geothrix campi]|uniref:hypothetical protein n=1 Tax=Geothrix campi TaxID=2966450 RepID=UPI0021474624|nr:hypothetical protein [Geothrix sp. SG10]